MPKMSKQRKRLYDDYGQMIRDNISVEKILFNLSNKIKNSCILKLYPNEDGYKKLEDKILKEIIFKRQKFLIDRITPKKKIFENSKLILNYSDGTSFLETISSDVPTIIFLPNLNWINLDAKRDYEKLLESKILFNNEKQMSKHINNIFNDVSSWWNNSRVKNCKSNFEKKYSQRPIKNALSFLANEIEKVI
jgi:putative transferase (TIGR04331 family)